MTEKQRKMGSKSTIPFNQFFPLLLYNIGIMLGLFFLWPVGIAYLLRVPKARAGFFEKLGYYPASVQQKLSNLVTGKPEERQRIWIHAVSVGELNAIKPLVMDLKADFDIILSATTRTGHDLACRTFPELAVVYFPFDLHAIIERAFSLIKPDLVILMETEIWPNFMDNITRLHHIPLLLINGRLSERSFKRYQWIDWLIGPCLNQLTHCYVQSSADAERFQALGGSVLAQKLTVMGNLKFDIETLPAHLNNTGLNNTGLNNSRQNQLALLLGIEKRDTVLVFASTHSGEDKPLMEQYILLKQEFPHLKVVLAPRHPERLQEIEGILKRMDVAFMVRSRLSEISSAEPSAKSPTTQLNQTEAVIILDSIGELSMIYGLSRLAIIGGSFVKKGGQNPLEALAQGIPVLFGPSMQHFKMVSDLIQEAQAGIQVKDTTVLLPVIRQLLTEPTIYQHMATQGQALLAKNRGAKDQLAAAIRGMFKK